MKSDGVKFWAFLARMKHIKRWSLMHSTTEENVMEHSWEVTAIAHALATVGNKRYGKKYDVEKVLLLAQYHEASEVITGDLPTPIKYFNPEIKTAYKALETTAAEKILHMLPEDLREEYRAFVLPEDSPEKVLVKAADRLAAYLKCVEELKSGNNEFKKAAESIYAELSGSPLPEARWFLENAAPAFGLTLDELD